MREDSGYAVMSGSGRRDERRREIRIAAVHPLRYSCDAEPRKIVKSFGLTRNVSKSGFCMYAGHDLEPGTAVEVSIAWLKTRLATVRWCEEKGGSHLCMLGLSFD